MVLVGALLVAAACSSGNDDDAAARPATSPQAVTTSAPASTTTGAPPEATVAPTTERAVETTIEPTAVPTVAPTTTPSGGWEQVVPGGDCRCADGSEFNFWVRRADPTKVLFFLQGGGACFDANSCNPIGGTYKSSVAGDDPNGLRGIFDFTNAANPLAHYSVVYVPYCTGDVHLGNRVTTYAPDRVINHVGAVNAGAALQEMVAAFPDAANVLVAGESAGSIPTPLYAGMIADLYPGAAINVLADSSGAYTNSGGANVALDSLWGVLGALPDWPEHVALTPEMLSFSGLFIQAGEHAPDITFARHDYAYDRVQALFSALAGAAPADLLAAIDGNEVQIEATGVDLLSYIAAGEGHTVLSSDGFYSEAVDGQPFADWVRGLVANQPIADVHCTTCR